MVSLTLASANGDPVEPQSAGMVETVVLRIRDKLRADGLRVGDTLPSEGETASQLGVSRTVVREAYRSMSALGLIDVGNGRKASVGAINPQSLALLFDHGVQTNQASVQQILDVRRTIEIRTVGLAALLRKDTEAREIAALASAMRADFAASERVMEHDIAFHEAIARASRNPMFSMVVASFGLVTRETWPLGWKARASNEERMAHVVCHEQIARDIAEGDRVQAEAHMASHFDSTAKVLLTSGIY